MLPPPPPSPNPLPTLSNPFTATSHPLPNVSQPLPPSPKRLPASPTLSQTSPTLSQPTRLWTDVVAYKQTLSFQFRGNEQISFLLVDIVQDAVVAHATLDLESIDFAFSKRSLSLDLTCSNNDVSARMQVLSGGGEGRGHGRAQGPGERGAGIGTGTGTGTGTRTGIGDSPFSSPFLPPFSPPPRPWERYSCNFFWGVIVRQHGKLYPWEPFFCMRGGYRTILSVLSIVPRHRARLTYFLHPKLRIITAVRTVPQPITLPLRRLQCAGSNPPALASPSPIPVHVPLCCPHLPSYSVLQPGVGDGGRCHGRGPGAAQAKARGSVRGIACEGHGRLEQESCNQGPEALREWQRVPGSSGSAASGCVHFLQVLVDCISNSAPAKGNIFSSSDPFLLAPPEVQMDLKNKVLTLHSVARTRDALCWPKGCTCPLWWAKKKLTAAAARNLFVDLCHRGVAEATQGLKVPKIFQDLSYINPKEAKSRVPFQFMSPQPEVQGADCPPVAAMPKPKAAARQLTMAAFLAKK